MSSLSGSRVAHPCNADSRVLTMPEEPTESSWQSGYAKLQGLWGQYLQALRESETPQDAAEAQRCAEELTRKWDRLSTACEQYRTNGDVRVETLEVRVSDAAATVLAPGGTPNTSVASSPPFLSEQAGGGASSSGRSLSSSPLVDISKEHQSPGRNLEQDALWNRLGEEIGGQGGPASAVKNPSSHSSSSGNDLLSELGVALLSPDELSASPSAQLSPSSNPSLLAERPVDPKPPGEAAAAAAPPVPRFAVLRRFGSFCYNALSWVGNLFLAPFRWLENLFRAHP